MQEPFTTFDLPLPNPPPDGFGWDGGNITVKSTSTAFDTGLDQRDVFFGIQRCVICGVANVFRCHVIGKTEKGVWQNLKTRGWIPQVAKVEPKHEPRNGLLMCGNHHWAFDNYQFFIRFVPNIRRFVFVNHSNMPEHEAFHGKIIALDIADRHAPFPSIFIIHEMRVRGFHPFEPVVPYMPAQFDWQHWIVSGGVWSEESGSFHRTPPPPSEGGPGPSAQSQLQFQPRGPSAEGRSSSGNTLALNASVIAEILAATRVSPSWRACQVEGTSWTGTAEENSKRYISTIGIESSPGNP